MRKVAVTLWTMVLVGDAGMGVAQSAPSPVDPPSTVIASGPLELSIEDALRLALRDSEQIAIAQAGVERARADTIRALSEWLPQISASAGYTRTFASEYEDLFSTEPTDTTDDGTGETPTDDGTGGSTSAFTELPFGQANTWRFGLVASEVVYAGGRRLHQNQVAIATGDNARLNLASSMASTALDAAQAYYDAILTDRLYAIAESTLRQSEDTLAQTRLKFELGTVPEFDLLRATVSYENQKPAVLQRRYERDLALFRLKQLLDIPATRPLKLTTGLEIVDGEEAVATARSVADVPVQTGDLPRVAVRQASTAVRLRSSAVGITRAAYLPNLSVNTQYGRVAYPDEFFPGWDDFRTNWTAGVNLSIPLFNGFRSRGDMLSARADLLEARVQLELVGELAELDTRSAQEQLATALSTWQASGGTVDQAKRAYEIADLRFRQGVSTQLELSDARILLEQAQANRARASRDFQVARIRVALLPNLPLTSNMGAGMTPATGGSSQQ